MAKKRATKAQKVAKERTRRRKNPSFGDPLKPLTFSSNTLLDFLLGGVVGVLAGAVNRGELDLRNAKLADDDGLVRPPDIEKRRQKEIAELERLIEKE